MIWALAPVPGGTYLTVFCDDEDEFDHILSLRFCLFDGQRADVQEAERRNLFIRFILEAPFRMPPVRLRFEDEGVADDIARTGWYTMDGGLYRATLIEPGTLLLDQVYASEPPPQYHGRQLEPLHVTQEESVESSN